MCAFICLLFSFWVEEINQKDMTDFFFFQKFSTSENSIDSFTLKEIAEKPIEKIHSIWFDERWWCAPNDNDDDQNQIRSTQIHIRISNKRFRSMYQITKHSTWKKGAQRTITNRTTFS